MSNEFNGKIFRRIALESCPTVHLGGGPITVSESYPAIHLGGLSNRILSENWDYVFKNKNLFVLKTVFLTLDLGMREGVGEDSSHGIEHVDIRVGIMNSLECECLPLHHEHLGGE